MNQKLEFINLLNMTALHFWLFLGKNKIIRFIEEKCSDFLHIRKVYCNFAESHEDTMSMAILHVAFIALCFFSVFPFLSDICYFIDTCFLSDICSFSALHFL